ncbi:hypothetical protein CEP51_011725 [Fusarium floridanum]|uniref:C2H2-type domain-containing protein n=1 Tax=Fusarium floridanum TaxID=1325733 RepID=A0A428R7K6_9HYPO|nr:hypothetical protein CEP51_011725 [Fusarium floridanum]
MIQYRQSHRNRLATVAPEDNDEGAPSKIFETVATTYEERAQGEIGGPRDRRSMFTSATSFVSSYGNDLGRRIPDLPDMTLEGVQLGYREPIECPYCRTIQVLANRAEWRKHVFSDLQPYVCTFKDCTAELFTTRQEWFSHEINTHRQDWVCIHCGDSKTFHSPSALKSHLGIQHPREITHNQLETMLEACQCAPKRIGSGECPLCEEWAPPAVESQNVKEFCRHLARHQQMLALEALPISVEGLELQATASGSDDDQDPEDEGPRMQGCTRCATMWSEDGRGEECPLCHQPGYVNDPGMSSKMPEGWQDMIASESQLYFAHGAAVWPERSSPTASQEARPVDETQVAADTQRRYSGLFHSALPMTEQEEETLENAEPWHRPSGYNVLWMAASLFEFNIPTPADRREGGYQYLLYQPGEIFDVIGEKGELWLAMNQDDPSGQVGWIWSKHFAKLADS